VASEPPVSPGVIHIWLFQSHLSYSLVSKILYEDSELHGEAVADGVEEARNLLNQAGKCHKKFSPNKKTGTHLSG